MCGHVPGPVLAALHTLSHLVCYSPQERNVTTPVLLMRHLRPQAMLLVNSRTSTNAQALYLLDQPDGTGRPELGARHTQEDTEHHCSRSFCTSGTCGRRYLLA